MFNNLYMKYTGEKVEFNFTQLKSSQALKFGTEMINIRVFNYIYIFSEFCRSTNLIIGIRILGVLLVIFIFFFRLLSNEFLWLDNMS